jgi:predicted nucleic acid-binding protein
VILCDSNVLLDILVDDPRWAAWSLAQLEAWSKRGPVIVNPVVYAELAAGYDSVEALDGDLEYMGLRYEEIPRDGLFLAAKAHLLYRRRGGTRAGVLADFFVGAHAAVRRLPLLTRDARRYRAFYPTVELVTPD